MTVRANDRVGAREACAVFHDDAREELEIDLVNDACLRGDDLEVVEGTLAPTQEGIALTIALEFTFCIYRQRIRRAEGVHLHGVIDDHLRRLERIDLARVTAESGHGITHRG